MSPDSTACLINFAWLLSGHRDPAIRRPTEAVQHAERAVALTARADVEALDVLAAAYASADRFDAAVREPVPRPCGCWNKRRQTHRPRTSARVSISTDATSRSSCRILDSFSRRSHEAPGDAHA